MKKGLFITFEGGEGAGKTTQIKHLSKWMSDRGIKHMLTKEPGCPHIEECKKIRKLVLDPQNDLIDRSELFLFLADRAQHVQKFIKPNMEDGVHVIGDRFADSTRIYQCARGFSRIKVDMLLEVATAGLAPDLTFVLDVPVEVGLTRAKATSIYTGGDRMERAGTKFHEDVRHGFLKLAESDNRFRVINAAPPRTIEEISNEIIEIVSKKLWADFGE